MIEDTIKKSLPFLEKMLLIRRLEERLLELYSQGKLNGTVHTCIGQEACAVGILDAIDTDKDIVVSNHRSHGHYVSYGGPVNLLIAEIMGKISGVCKGIGGSQHLHYKNFYSNGVLGGTIAMAVGMAYAEKYKESDNIIVVFLGDGCLGEGIVYESMNMASLWRLPVLFVIEANNIAQSTAIEKSMAGKCVDRPKAFGIETVEIERCFPSVVSQHAKLAVSSMRESKQPCALVLHAGRLGPHSKGDDSRDDMELQQISKNDILNQLIRVAPKNELDRIESRVLNYIDTAIMECEEAETIPMDTYSNLVGIVN